jgi:hypothetical protein
MKCIAYDNQGVQCDQESTVFSPTGKGYCQQHSKCPHCGGSVANFVRHIIKGTITIEVYICPCVVQHGEDVHNEVIVQKAKRADQEAQDKKKRKRIA